MFRKYAVILGLISSACFSFDVMAAESDNTEITTEIVDTTENIEPIEEIDNNEQSELGTFEPYELTTEEINHGGYSMTLSEYQSMVANNSDSFTLADNDRMFYMMQNSLDKGEDISLSTAFAMSERLNIPDNYIFDISSSGFNTNFDASSINLQYGNLINQMSLNADALRIDLSDKTTDAVSLFNNTYGDLATQFQLGEASLPDNFSFNDVVSQNNIAMNNAYGSILESSDYQGVKNSLNISGIFSQASHGLGMPGLASISDLNTLKSSYNSQTKSDWETRSQNQKASDWGTYAHNLATINTDKYSNYADFMSSYNEVIGKVDEITNKERNNSSLGRVIVKFGKEGAKIGQTIQQEKMINNPRKTR